MKKIFCKQKLKQNFKELMKSTRKKFSQGANFILKGISWARGDNWRRQDKKSKK